MQNNISKLNANHQASIIILARTSHEKQNRDSAVNYSFKFIYLNHNCVKIIQFPNIFDC